MASIPPSPSDVVVIGSLRVQGQVADPAAARLAIDRQLQGAEISPEELSPSAWLVVRHLTDPLPGRLEEDQARLRPPRAWSAAVRGSLRDLAEEAARPSETGLADTAAAVLFADEAELLACLVLDAVRGQLGTRWWWQRIRVAMPALGWAVGGAGDAGAPGTSPRDAVRALLAHPRELPAVFSCLSRWGADVEVVAAFDDQGACELLRAMATAHGLEASLVVPAAGGRADRAGPAWRAPAAGAAPSGATAQTNPSISAVLPEAHVNPLAMSPADPTVGETARLGEPWRDWLPSTALQGLPSPVQRCLLGIGLALQGAPTVVREPGFARRVQAWWQRQDYIEHPPSPSQGSGPSPLQDLGSAPDRGSRTAAASTPASGVPQPARPALPAIPPHAEPDRTAASQGAESQPPEHAATTLTAAACGLPAPADDASHVFANAAASRADVYGARPYPSGADDFDRGNTESPAPSGALVQAADETERGGTVTLGPAQLPTRLGGILYLIHALEDLDVPAVFESGWRLATRLGPWGTLALVARAILGERLADVADDGIWEMLADLDRLDRVGDGTASRQGTCVGGLDDHPSGARRQGRWLDAFPEFRAPPPWRARLGASPGPLHWTVARGRLWLWSRDRYLIACMRRDLQHPSQQARSEAARWSGSTDVALQRGRLAQLPLSPLHRATADPALRALLAAVVPAVACRLRLALDVRPDSGACDRSGGELDGGGFHGGGLHDGGLDDEGGLDDDGALWRLLCVEGQLHATTSHIDLVAALDEIWLPARRAGLDRSPGWLADYGRVVLFHFR